MNSKHVFLILFLAVVCANQAVMASENDNQKIDESTKSYGIVKNNDLGGLCKFILEQPVANRQELVEHITPEIEELNNKIEEAKKNNQNVDGDNVDVASETLQKMMKIKEFAINTLKNQQQDTNIKGQQPFSITDKDEDTTSNQNISNSNTQPTPPPLFGNQIHVALKPDNDDENSNSEDDFDYNTQEQGLSQEEILEIKDFLSGLENTTESIQTFINKTKTNSEIEQAVKDDLQKYLDASKRTYVSLKEFLQRSIGIFLSMPSDISTKSLISQLVLEQLNGGEQGKSLKSSLINNNNNATQSTPNPFSSATPLFGNNNNQTLNQADQKRLNDIFSYENSEEYKNFQQDLQQTKVKAIAWKKMATPWLFDKNLNQMSLPSSKTSTNNNNPFVQNGNEKTPDVSQPFTSTPFNATNAFASNLQKKLDEPSDISKEKKDAQEILAKGAELKKLWNYQPNAANNKPTECPEPNQNNKPTECPEPNQNNKPDSAQTIDNKNQATPNTTSSTTLPASNNNQSTTTAPGGPATEFSTAFKVGVTFSCLAAITACTYYYYYCYLPTNQNEQNN